MGAGDGSRSAKAWRPPPRWGFLTPACRLARLVVLSRSIASVVVSIAICTGICAGCSKKLTKSGSAMDAIAYDLLGMERSTAEYYEIVRSAHDSKTFNYERTGDPYIADKSLDAVIHLGDATYNRLEGEVQVILLLSDVLVEDRIALARDTAAGSLTRLALKLPDSPVTPIPDSGVRWLALTKGELDGMHDESGRLRQDTPGNRRRVVAIADELGALEFTRLVLDKDALRFFPQKAYVTLESDPTLRAAWDRAMVRRSRALIFASLEGGVFDPAPHVRSSCITSLATLHRAKAMDSILDRLKAENDSWVRATIAAYLGEIAGPKAVDALIGLLHDDDGGVRHAARVELTRIAGSDLGNDAAAWESWRARAHPAPRTANPAGSSSPTPTPSGSPPR